MSLMETKAIAIILILGTSMAQTTTFGPATVSTAGPTVDILPQPNIYDTSTESLAGLFAQFKYDYSRNYPDPNEEAFRFDLFVNNLNHINEHNEQYPAINYTLDITDFIDWTEEEFDAIQGDIISNDTIFPSDSSITSSVRRLANNIPTKLDWADPGKNTLCPIQNQGPSPSCWAFAATGAWEARWFIKCRIKYDISEQELVDCVTPGFAGNAFNYGADKDGDSLAAAYPYNSKNPKKGACAPKKHVAPLKDPTGFGWVRPQNGDSKTEDAIIAALQEGPIVVSINASPWKERFFKAGVYDGDCSANTNHAVVIVGYGVLKRNNKQIKYWKIRNSWGNWGGDGGYLKICRDCGKNGKKGQCGMHRRPIYPIPICPTTNPTTDPTTDPTIEPTMEPTLEPTMEPTNIATFDPTTNPTFYPSLHPTLNPIIEATVSASSEPTVEPTTNPISRGFVNMISHDFDDTDYRNIDWNVLSLQVTPQIIVIILLLLGGILCLIYCACYCYKYDRYDDENWEQIKLCCFKQTNKYEAVPTIDDVDYL